MPVDTAVAVRDEKRQQALSSRTFQRWRQLVSDLPDVRLKKVLAIREALKGREYDGEAVLDETVDRLGNEIGILCRRACTSNEWNA